MVLDKKNSALQNHKKISHLARFEENYMVLMGKSQASEIRAGIEPAHRGFADPGVSTSPPDPEPILHEFRSKNKAQHVVY